MSKEKSTTARACFPSTGEHCLIDFTFNSIWYFRSLWLGPLRYLKRGRLWSNWRWHTFKSQTETMWNKTKPHAERTKGSHFTTRNEALLMEKRCSCLDQLCKATELLDPSGTVCKMRERGKRMGCLVIVYATRDAGPFISFRSQVR